MEHSLIVRCSDCGNLAKRTYTQAANTVVTTECPHCDYYTVVSFNSGEVIEAHTSCTAIANRPQTSVPIIQPKRPILLRPLFDLPA